MTVPTATLQTLRPGAPTPTRTGFPMTDDANGLRALRIAAAALLPLALAACGTDRVVTGSASRITDDYRERHPIVLTDAPETLDVFVGENAPRLDERQEDDVTAFAKSFRQAGKGGVTALVPMGAAGEIGTHRGLNAIRSAFSKAGANVHLNVQTYRVSDPSVAAPIRLTFMKLQAKLPHRCGQWPDDVGGANTLNSWQNQNYWNFGCAYQQNLAAQVADPRDLARPRAESRIDTIKRTRGIEDLRKAKDPSTTWTQQGTRINQGVGN